MMENGMKVMVREYLPEDFEKIEKIHDAARKEELRFAKLQQAFLPFSVAAERENFFDYKICTAILYGKVVGFAAYSEDELAWLYVDSAYFRRGIGRALVEYVLAHTSRPVWVEVLSGNVPAESLYRSVGFEKSEICSGKMPGNEKFPVTVIRLCLK